jgi:uncharacterized protein YdcH (DUF465 family)
MQDQHLDRALSEEFADKAVAIHELKAADPRFKELLELNHGLWAQIQQIQENIRPAEDSVRENLEKRRLAVLDEISARLRASSS